MTSCTSPGWKAATVSPHAPATTANASDKAARRLMAGAATRVADRGSSRREIAGNALAVDPDGLDGPKRAHIRQRVLAQHDQVREPARDDLAAVIATEHLGRPERRHPDRIAGRHAALRQELELAVLAVADGALRDAGVCPKSELH